jgi:hypothetical protein
MLKLEGEASYFLKSLNGVDDSEFELEAFGMNVVETGVVGTAVE